MVVSGNRQEVRVRQGVWVCLSARFHVAWLLLPVTLFPLTSGIAKDCGTHGTIFPIEEADPILLIQQKLKSLEESGDLRKHQKALQKKTQEAVKRPTPVEGVIKTTESRLFYYDPTYVVEHDLKDHIGKVFAKAGTKINPLKTTSLSHALLFFDGDDEEQKAWAHIRSQEAENSDQKVRLILTKGAPLTLSEELGVPIYFDQGGTLTKKLGIRHVPALVTQEEFKLRIEEMHPSFLTETQSLETKSPEKKSHVTEEGAILERPQVKTTKTKRTKTGYVSKTSCLDGHCLSQDREAGS